MFFAGHWLLYKLREVSQAVSIRIEVFVEANDLFRVRVLVDVQQKRAHCALVLFFQDCIAVSNILELLALASVFEQASERVILSRRCSYSVVWKA